MKESKEVRELKDRAENKVKPGKRDGKTERG
jgi:hypothetical protein